jgi:hypothetical protein
MPSNARAACGRILDDVQSLIGYHPTIRNPGSGRPRGRTRPLLHACTILTYTAWEVYVEDLVLEVVPMLQRDMARLPQELRKLTAERVKDNPWSLAGDQWKTEIEKAIRSRSIGDGKSWGLNTANSKNVMELFTLVFGESVLVRCSWKGMSATLNQDYVDQLVERRGHLAHRGSLPEGQLNLSLVRDWAEWVGKLADRVDEIAASILEARTGTKPW